MTKTSMTTAGIDTSKLKLDIAVHGRTECWQVANALSGWRTLAANLTKAGVTRVGIEATGGYERGVVEHLRTTGFTVLVLQPVQVKAFGRVHMRRAKNDTLDARLIAACAATLDQPRIAPDPRLAELAGYLTFLEQLEEDIARFKTRLEHIDESRLRRIVISDITRLKARRAAQIRDIAKRLRAHADLAKRLDLVLSIPGLGERTALALIVRMPELGRVSREEAAALAGLAPFDEDSGQHKGQRHIAGGRGRLRRSLFAAALPAAFRWNLVTGAQNIGDRGLDGVQPVVRIAHPEDVALRRRLACIDVCVSIRQRIGRGRFDFMTDYAIPFTSRNLARVILDDSNAERIQRAIAIATRISGEGEPQAFFDMAALAEEFLRDRAASGSRREDVLSAIVHGTVQGRPLTLEEQVGATMIMFTGGLDTTKAALGNIARHLAEDPSLEQRLRDPEWIKGDLDEFLRYESPIMFMARTVTRDTELGGCPLQPGDRVAVHYASANRDESRFEHADRLDFGRQRNPHAAFGELLSRVTNLRIPADGHVQTAVGIVLTPGHLPVVFDVRPTLAVVVPAH